MSCAGLSVAMSAKVSPLEKLVLIAIGDCGGNDDNVFHAKMDYLRVVTFSSDDMIQEIIKRLVEQGVLLPAVDLIGNPGYRFNPKHPALDKEAVRYVS